MLKTPDPDTFGGQVEDQTEGLAADDALSILVERLRPRLLREIDRQIGDYLRKRFDGEDILQSTFRTFFRRTDDGQYNWDHTSALFQLLLAIATNKVRHAARYHTQRKRDVRKEACVSAAEVDPNDFIGDDDLADDVSDIVARVGEIFDQLPKRDAEFFRRRYVENQTYGRIHADTGWSLSTIKRVLRETRLAIREQIEAEEKVFSRMELRASQLGVLEP